MTDISDLVQEFWRISSGGAGGPSFFAMRRLFEILQECLECLEVCFDITFVSGIAVDLADKILQKSANSLYNDFDDFEQIRAKFKALFDGFRKMFDQSLSKSKDLGDVLRFLPGVVVQNYMSMQGMADLYRIKPDLLERFIESTIEPLRSSPGLNGPYILEAYLSGFLQDRDRSQHYYCDPILQHISICRHILSLLDKPNAFEFQS